MDDYGWVVIVTAFGMLFAVWFATRVAIQELCDIYDRVRGQE